MADQIVASLVGPAVEEVGRSAVATIKRQFNYLCCFNNNIQSLRDEARNLENARAGLQGQADAAENNAEVIVPEVKTWLADASNKIQVDVSGIVTEVPNVQSGCLTIKSRFELSRKAKKLAESMRKLLQVRLDFHTISLPPPPLATTPISLGTTHAFPSRNHIEEEIMKALGDKKANMMGICGMGGVGKTIMAKRIMKRVSEKKLFKEVLMVVVSQSVDMMKIQRDIAESLGLTLQEESLLARANRLRIRLRDAKEKLIILDDVWEELKLEDLGIPCESGDTRCVVLLTSRNEDALNRMCNGKFCVMNPLSGTEAWDLFREKVGECVDDSNLRSIAKKVAKECKGLPVALLAVGSALKDQKSIHDWRAALQQLEDSYPVDVPDFIAEVYNPLKLSYEYLQTPNAKSLFLLFRLFPEDYDINLEELALYCMGLRIFEGVRNLEQARDRVFTIVRMLKSRFLLLDGSERHVKMHDVVRDVANFIAVKQGLVDKQGHSNRYCKWISVFMENKTELQSHCLLTVGGLSINFEEMKELNVLSMYFLSLESLPLTTQLLKNLGTLRLEFCTLEKLSVVGELSNLEILCCRGCKRIKELPVEIGD